MKAKPFAVLVLMAMGALALAAGAPSGAAPSPVAQVAASQPPRQEVPRQATDSLLQSAEADTLPARHPVLLVHGWMAWAWDLTALRERFLRDGWTEEQVVALQFENVVGSNQEHAQELEAAIRGLKESTGAAQVDLVVHSMGGLALWILLREKGDQLPVRRVVFLGSPLQGTLTAHLAWGEGGEEMRPGSPLLEELAQGPGPDRWVDALTIRTPLDFTVFPVSGATLPGIGDRMVCCPTHQGLLDHEETYVIARDFLLFGHRLEEQNEEDGAG